jgi:hypothetical protein
MRHSFPALLVTACLAQAGCASGLSITMSRSQLQRRVETQFPMEHDLLAATLELTDPEILLQKGLDKVGMSLSTEVVLVGGKTFTGKVSILGDVSYEQSAGAFYLTHPQLVDLQIPSLPDGLRQPVTAAVNLGMIAFLRRFPLYQLQGNVEQSARLYIKSVTVEDGEVRVQMTL